MDFHPKKLLLQISYNFAAIVASYYRNLHGDECERFMNDMEGKINTDNRSMVVYYRTIANSELSNIYTSFTNDYFRKIVTRWRLSNHSLKIETQRYCRPHIPRENRVCTLCNKLEDEAHVIFECPLYHAVRRRHELLLAAKQNIKDLLNPEHDNIIDTAKLLYDIEHARKDLNL